MKKLIKHAFRKLGLEISIAKPAKLSRLENFFSLWRRLGFKPSCIFDVGANRGNWTRTALRHFPGSNFVLIEPQEALNRYYEDLILKRTVQVINVGCSDSEGMLELALPTRDDSASFRADAVACNPTIEVKIKTLDSLTKELCSIPDICKIDAEGFDLRVLHGAKTLLGTTEVFLIEAAICASGLENTIEQIVEFMGNHGYRVFDFTDLNYSPRDSALWLTEIVFVKNNLPIWQALSSYE